MRQSRHWAKLAVHSTRAAMTASARATTRPVESVVRSLNLVRVRTWDSAQRSDVPFGSVHSVPIGVPTDDGIVIHVEVDEPTQPDPHGITVVFCHGYLCNVDFWHFQRLALRGSVRSVYWDLRAHGNTAAGQEVSLARLTRDLEAVLAEVAPDGPIVLVGHSTGAMTIMGLAQRHPHWFGSRVKGVALMSSSARLTDYTLGLHRFGNMLLRGSPHAVKMLTRIPRSMQLVERARRLGAESEKSIVKGIAFASDTDDELLSFTARMIGSARLDTAHLFLHMYSQHDVTEALTVMKDVEAIVLVGDCDPILPVEHSEAVARALPHAQFSVVPRSGHLIPLEHPGVVTPHLVGLLHRVRYRLDQEAHQDTKDTDGR